MIERITNYKIKYISSIKKKKKDKLRKEVKIYTKYEMSTLNINKENEKEGKGKNRFETS